MRNYHYEWPRPGLTVGAIIICNDDILLIKRGIEPFKNFWALPGGYVQMGEDCQWAMRRELKEETGLDIMFTRENQLGAFSAPNRLAGDWNVQIAYIFDLGKMEAPPAIRPDDDAIEAKWTSVESLPPLAFDHLEQITFAIRKGVL